MCFVVFDGVFSFFCWVFSFCFFFCFRFGFVIYFLVLFCFHVLVVSMFVLFFWVSFFFLLCGGVEWVVGCLCVTVFLVFDFFSVVLSVLIFFCVVFVFVLALFMVLRGVGAGRVVLNVLWCWAWFFLCWSYVLFLGYGLIFFIGWCLAVLLFGVYLSFLFCCWCWLFWVVIDVLLLFGLFVFVCGGLVLVFGFCGWGLGCLWRVFFFCCFVLLVFLVFDFWVIFHWVFGLILVFVIG